MDHRGLSQLQGPMTDKLTSLANLHEIGGEVYSLHQRGPGPRRFYNAGMREGPQTLWSISH